MKNNRSCRRIHRLALRHPRRNHRATPGELTSAEQNACLGPRVLASQLPSARQFGACCSTLPEQTRHAGHDWQRWSCECPMARNRAHVRAVSRYEHESHRTCTSKPVQRLSWSCKHSSTCRMIARSRQLAANFARKNKGFSHQGEWMRVGSSNGYRAPSWEHSAVALIRPRLGGCYCWCVASLFMIQRSEYLETAASDVGFEKNSRDGCLVKRTDIRLAAERTRRSRDIVRFGSESATWPCGSVLGCHPMLRDVGAVRISGRRTPA